MTRQSAGRRVENFGLTGAVLIVLCYGLADIASRTGLAPCTEGGFPWVLVVMVVSLVLPKVLGRATAGSIWIALLGGRRGPDPHDPGA